LQARIKQYEQGEVDRSVTFQTLGKRLKVENEALKEQNRRLNDENELLKARLAQVTGVFEQSSAAAAAPGTLHRGVKRGRVESPSMTTVSLKRLKITESPHLGVSSLNTPCSSDHSVSSHGQFKDDNESFMDDRYRLHSPITDNGNIGQDPHVAHDSCGMCTSSVDCLCRELGIRAPMNPMLDENEDVTMSMFDNQSSISQPAKVRSPAEEGPLLTSTNNTSSGCSGNPRDCSACKDSAFGRAFCAALGKSVCMLNPCPTCQPNIEPSSPKSEDTVMLPVNNEPATLPLTINPTLTQCCGHPAQCKGGACSPAGPKTPSREASRPRRNKPTSHERTPHRTNTPDLAPLTMTTTTTQKSDTVSCDTVWRALEAHPNAHLANPIAGPSQLANLNMLADVVAGRSYCTLAPGEPTPEPEDFPRRARPRPPPHPRTRTRGRGWANAMDISDAVVDDHADARVTIAYEDEQNRDTREPERMMVPREVLQGHQRITAVPKEGMRVAIALMDQQFEYS